MASLSTRYQSRLDAGAITVDAGQRGALQALDDLSRDLPRLARKPLPFFKVAEGKRGLYLYGRVGRGKTMLMDLFFEGVAGIPKRRVHFHEFMAELHERLFRLRGQENALDKAATEILAGARLLCFDEFQVYNIADAMILGRLFRRLFALGAVIVATSNTKPDELYKDGLQRALFIPFIEIIKKRLTVVAIGDGADHRLERLKGMPVYISPHNEVAHGQLEAMFDHLTDSARPAPQDFDINGRTLHVPRAAHQAAWFGFSDLCRVALGPSDYAVFCEHYRTFLVEDVPELTDAERDASLRFIHLIDVLYEKHAIIILTAAKPLESLMARECSLYPRFERAQSRLFEMQSDTYIKAQP